MSPFSLRSISASAAGALNWCRNCLSDCSFFLSSKSSSVAMIARGTAAEAAPTFCMILYEAAAGRVFQQFARSRAGERDLFGAFFQRAAEELGVANIRLKADVEDVANDRNNADQPVNDQVEQHARAKEQSQSVLLGHVDGIEADQRRDRVAQDGNEADDGVEPEAHAGEFKLGVHEPGEAIDALQIALGVGLFRCCFAATCIDADGFGHESNMRCKERCSMLRPTAGSPACGAGISLHLKQTEVCATTLV